MWLSDNGGTLPSTVAVGTAIADRPPHISVRARSRIRLLPRRVAAKRPAALPHTAQSLGHGSQPPGRSSDSSIATDTHGLDTEDERRAFVPQREVFVGTLRNGSHHPTAYPSR